MSSDSANRPLVGVIGGSGLYQMDDLTELAIERVATPFGMPSDEIVVGTLEGTRVAFLPRHGKGHRYTPSEVPYRANIWALKSLGVEFVVSVSAVGSMKEAIVPGHLVVVDQFIDRTVGRERTFFGDGAVGHIAFGDPVCGMLREILLGAAKKTEAPEVHKGGTYICIEGPQFSTRAESLLFRSWGVDVIGMTNLPEARLAREAELSYATLALATDYDCWHDAHDDVSVANVLAILQQNVKVAQQVVREVAKTFAAADAPKQSPFKGANATTVMTPKELIPRDKGRALQLMVSDLLG